MKWLNINFGKKAMALLLLLSSSALFAHTTVMDIEQMNGSQSSALYLALGFTHILPNGFDHILFVLGLYILNPKLKPVLLQTTLFTVAHTITLGLSMYRIITPPAGIVEPIIAASILYVAIENIFSQKLKSSRLALVFLFGLVHGMGFASSLNELGLPQNRFLSSLLLFNIGVELGQVTVILAAWLLFGKWFATKTYYRKLIVIPISVIIGSFAIYLLGSRMSFNKAEAIISADTIEQVCKNYSDSSLIKSETEISFWRNRIHPQHVDYTNSMKYAGALAQHFKLNGNIDSLKKSDSILLSLTQIFKQTETGPYLALSRHCILQHEFARADSFLQVAQKIGLKKYEAASAGFDLSFEMGYMQIAERLLQQFKTSNDYGYQFRCSKLMHYKGNEDSAINAMNASLKLSAFNSTLQHAALSNLGDLYMHTGDVIKAKECYMQSVIKYKSELHSYMGLAWIALMHDKNDTLAYRLLSFVAGKTTSPEPLFKLIAVAQQRNNIQQTKTFAAAFANAASDMRYGKMYNKQLIRVYSTILNNPKKAVDIAQSELRNRNTAQTQAWYAYALFKNNQLQQALQVFKQNVAGKPLEALELYWMGKLMQASDNKATAARYFIAAAKNKFDLDPAIINDLDAYID